MGLGDGVDIERQPVEFGLDVAGQSHAEQSTTFPLGSAGQLVDAGQAITYASYVDASERIAQCRTLQGRSGTRYSALVEERDCRVCCIIRCANKPATMLQKIQSVGERSGQIMARRRSVQRPRAPHRPEPGGYGFGSTTDAQTESRASLLSRTQALGYSSLARTGRRRLRTARQALHHDLYFAVSPQNSVWRIEGTFLFLIVKARSTGSLSVGIAPVTYD